MPPAVPPSVALAAVLVLLGTQVSYILAPRRPPYLLRLAGSALAVAVGELLGALGVGAGLAVGDLHPLQDLALLATLQWGVTRWARRGQPA